ncbi:MAG: GAF domain-containing protein [Gemmatimonadetes bacterium]|nr:GAF domain-containing protein [Gemmatimonadota bacterium]
MSHPTPPEVSAEVLALRVRVAELTRERENLVAMVDILQGIAGATQYPDILAVVAKKLGETFDLDRCSVFLFGEQPGARLVASYEDPTIRNLEVDLTRYPELQRALESGETVHIPDVSQEPSLRLAWPMLTLRHVRAVIVVPIKWRAQVVGALFLRTRRSLPPLTDEDVRFVQVVAVTTARALRQAHHFEALLRDGTTANEERAAERRRIALLAFVRRLLERVDEAQPEAASEAALDGDARGELDRLVGVALTVFDEQLGR